MLQKILKYVIYIGLFLICLVPLAIADGHSLLSFFLPGLLFPFITGKVFLFRIIVEIIFSVWLILVLIDRDYLPKKSLILWSLVGFLGIITLSDIFGVSHGKSIWSNFERMEGLLTHIHLFLFFLVAGAMISTQKLWNRFFHTNIGVSLFLVFYSILQLGGEISISQGGARVDGTLGNATYLAIYLLFTILFSFFFCYQNLTKIREILHVYVWGSAGFLFWYFSYTRSANVEIGNVGGWLSFVALLVIGVGWFLLSRDKRKPLPEYSRIIAYSFLIILGGIILFLTATRGAIIALVIGLIFISLMLAKQRSGNNTLRKISIGLIVTLLVAGGFFVGFRNTEFIKKNAVFSRFSSLTSENLRTFFTSGEGKSRYINGKASLEAFKERPLLGWGQENFNYVFYKYYDPKMYDQEPWFDRAHNVIFDWLVVGGILGLLAYLSIFASVFYYLFVNKKKEQVSYVSRVVLSGLLLAYFLQNLTVFDNITSYILFFGVLAYLHFLYGKDVPTKSNKKIETNRMFVKYVTLLIVVVFIASLYFVNIRSILASKNVVLSLQKGNLDQKLEYFNKALSYGPIGKSEVREFLGQAAQEISVMKVDPKIKEEFFNLAESEFKKQLEETPRDVKYYYFTAVFYGNNKQYDEAVSYLEKARELSPKKQTILLQLGVYYMSIGNYEKGNLIFKEAYEIAPEYNRAKMLYALSFVYLKKENLAIDLLGEEEYFEILESDIQFASVFEVIGEYRRAIELWKKWVLKYPDDITYRVSLIVAYLKANDRQTAILETRKAIDHFPEFKSEGESLIRQIQEGRTI